MNASNSNFSSPIELLVSFNLFVTKKKKKKNEEEMLLK